MLAYSSIAQMGFMLLGLCSGVVYDNTVSAANSYASSMFYIVTYVLTTLGTTFAGRVAASLLNTIGLPDMVMPTVDQYVASAIGLAGDPAVRARIRKHLAGPGRSSPLFDTARTTQALEAAYLAMADQYRKGVRNAFLVQNRRIETGGVQG